MRIQSLEVSGFRAFTRPQRFDLGADCIIVTGHNGTGKTSLFDAVLWGLTGSVPRLGDASVVSLYSPAREARVSLVLRETHGGDWAVSRTTSEKESTLTLSRGGETFRGPSAEIRLQEILWPAAIQSQRKIDLASVVTRSAYLQQDLVRQFLESDSAENRFRTVSELMGAGDLTTFLESLERERNAWSRAKSGPQRDVAEAENRLAAIRSRLERLSTQTASLNQFQERLQRWIRSAIETLRGAGRDESDTSIDSLLRQLQTTESQASRGLALVRDATEDLRDTSERFEPGELRRLELTTRRLAKKRASLAGMLESARAQAAEERQKLIAEHEQQAELRALATLALRHLEDRCPVCNQEYERGTTTERLLALIEQQPGQDSPPGIEQSIEELAGRLAVLEVRLARAETQLETAKEGRQRQDSLRRELERALLGTGIHMPQKLERNTLSALAETITDLIHRVEELSTEGESLRLEQTRMVEYSQRQELLSELAAAERELRRAEMRLGHHERVGSLANLILDTARGAAQDVVERQVRAISPLFERIYARMDPHPAFTGVQLLINYWRGKGRLEPVVSDPQAQLLEQAPYPIFSSSQLNAVAVSLFLALNIGIPEVPLGAALLDDPLQTLDDVNLLGLVDTLRRVRDFRQLIVSTHEARYAALLERKLRPVTPSQSTRMIVFGGWTSDGPEVDSRVLERDPIAYRFAA
jgi:exonuclease SbcC